VSEPEQPVVIKRSGPRQRAAEVAGLRWLADAGAVRVVPIVAVDADRLVLARIDSVAPGRAEAEAFGRDLADLHAAGAPGFGAPWPGFIGPLPMTNDGADDWTSFYTDQRVLPFLRRAQDLGSVTSAEALSIERACARSETPAEPPSRIHGDLWSSNVLWRDGAWLIDPAAHGGHRETDLAMLALFGAPHLARIVAAYDEHRPLAEGWRERVGLHQLHPLLVHAVLFGRHYGRQAAQMAAA
jgi:fructosamine-3-kinase